MKTIFALTLLALPLACRSPESPPLEPKGPENPDIGDAGPPPGRGEPKTDPGQPIGPITGESSGAGALDIDAGLPDAGMDAGPAAPAVR